MLKKRIEADVVFSVPENRLPWLDIVFAGSIFLLSLLLVHETPIFHYDPLSAIIMAGFLLIALGYQKIRSQTIQRQDWYLWIFLMMDILPNIIYQGHTTLKTINFLFVNILLAYWFLSCAHHRILDHESDFILLDILHAVAHAPFRFLKPTLACFHNTCTFGGTRKDLAKILIGCIISFPVLLIILPLLSHADTTFETWLSMIHIDTTLVMEWIGTLMVTIPLFFYYFSMSYGNITNSSLRIYNKDIETKRLQNLSMIPVSIYTTLETILVITYLIFLFASFQSIITAVGASKELFSYSDFARQGFFELCIIGAINLTMILLIRLTASSHAISKMEKALILETLLLIISAMVKMIFYILSYHALTYLRVYASWFMIVLFGLFLILLLQKKETKHKVLPMVHYVMICFLILNVSNVSHWVSDAQPNQSYDDIEYRY